MSKDTYYPLVVSRDEDVTPTSFIYLCGVNYEYSEKQYKVTIVVFEAIVFTLKQKLFHQRMVGFVNKL